MQGNLRAPKPPREGCLRRPSSWFASVEPRGLKATPIDVQARNTVQRSNERRPEGGTSNTVGRSRRGKKTIRNTRRVRQS
ncbi:hypothetical protein ANCDUO_06711 [Ancylostoma duodenale]|uniref:Uncharacterized protein n=1 Tax=Ancylostoma duodenale TaxID=51022 RepID=A0A0C2GVC9_9BILA|nr:hypothetical protein ANCDUO_06711 [Ancylostoma duodenale]